MDSLKNLAFFISLICSFFGFSVTHTAISALQKAQINCDFVSEIFLTSKTRPHACGISEDFHSCPINDYIILLYITDLLTCLVYTCVWIKRNKAILETKLASKVHHVMFLNLNQLPIRARRTRINING